MRKKLVSLFLAVAMVVAFLPTVSIAAGENRIGIQINNSDGANAVVMYKFDTDAGFSSVTAADKDAGGNIKRDIPDGAKTVTIKVVPGDGFALNDYQVYRNGVEQSKEPETDIPTLVGSSGMTFPVDPTFVFVAHVGIKYVDWTTISWGGANVHVDNGQVKPDAFHVGNVTYSMTQKIDDDVNKIYPVSKIMPGPGELNKWLIDYGVVFSGDGDLFISETLKEKVSVDFHFIPDYGYQLTDIMETEVSLLQNFVPGQDVSTFTYNYPGSGNVHFIVKFTATRDIINNNSDIIDGVDIENGGNAIDSGNLEMTIADVSSDNVSDELLDEVGDSEVQYLDIELDQVVSKTGDNGSWSVPVEEFDEDIDVTLEVEGLDPNADYYILREHGSGDDTDIDVVPVDYNRGDSTISFSSNKFSTYALVKSTSSMDNDPRFAVFYDMREWFDEEGGRHGATIFVGQDDYMRSGEEHSFEQGKAIDFTLTPPEERADETPIVEIQVFHQGGTTETYRSNANNEDPNKIELDGNKFSFTPQSSDRFEVYVFWSDFDTVWCGEGEYMIQAECDPEGSMAFDKTTKDTRILGREAKYIFDSSDLPVTVTITPNEGYDVGMIIIGRTRYTIEVNDPENEALLSDLFDEATGTYKYTITGEEGEGSDNIYIMAHFVSNEEQGPMFSVEYDNREWFDDEDVRHGASVIVGENDFVDSFDFRHFEKNEPITFTLTSPEERTGDTPIVEIEVFRRDADPEVYRSDFESGDPHTIVLEGNKFTFTPDSDDNFVVRIWWSDFDAFWCGEGEYLIQADIDPNVKCTFDKPPFDTRTYGREVKWVFDESNLPITVTFTPNSGFDVSEIVIDSTTYRAEVYDTEFEAPLSELFDEATGSYKYTITGEENNGWNNVFMAVITEERGEIKTGWLQEEGSWYYINEDGTKATGWLDVNGVRYYLADDGKMVTGWKLIDYIWYYFRSSGAMAIGWEKVGKSWYFLDTNGALLVSWQKLGGVWYYFDTVNGDMVTGWRQIGAKWYYFDSNGHMLTDWQLLGGVWYYLDSVNGDMATDWKMVNNKWYYFDQNGHMLTGWRNIKGSWYYLNANGSMAKGWLKEGNVWYYLESNGAMVTGEKTINGKNYVFASSGACTNPYI